MDKKVTILLLAVMFFPLCMDGGKTETATTLQEPATSVEITATTVLAEETSPENTVMATTTQETITEPTSTPPSENCNKCSEGTACDKANFEGKVCFCDYPKEDGLYQTCRLEIPTLM